MVLTPAWRRKLDFLIGVPLIYALHFFARKHSFHCQPTQPKKVLAIKLAAIGDTVLLIPVLRGLRRTHPDVQIHWLVSPINQELANTVPYVDRLILLEKLGIISLVKLVILLRREKYDWVIDFEQWSRTTALLAYLTPATYRVGFDTSGQKRSLLFDASYKKKKDQHELKNFAGLLNLLGLSVEDPELELWEDATASRKIEVFFQSTCRGDRKHRLIFQPGCGADGKPREWPVENYFELARNLKEKIGDFFLFITGGPEEKEKALELSDLIPGSISVAGKINLLELSSLVRRASLVVSGNTGIVHLAAAWKVPQVVLHGPTSLTIWGPLNPNAKVVKTLCPSCPCLDLGFEYHNPTDACMRKIDFAEVLSACLSLLKE